MDKDIIDKVKAKVSLMQGKNFIILNGLGISILYLDILTLMVI